MQLADIKNKFKINGDMLKEIIFATAVIIPISILIVLCVTYMSSLIPEVRPAIWGALVIAVAFLLGSALEDAYQESKRHKEWLRQHAEEQAKRMDRFRDEQLERWCSSVDNLLDRLHNKIIDLTAEVRTLKNRLPPQNIPENSPECPCAEVKTE